MNGWFFPSSGLRPTKRSWRMRCQKSNRAGDGGARTRSWSRLSAWLGTHDRGFLPPAEHVCIQLDRRRKGHVPEISSVLQMARAHGKPAGDAKIARNSAATRSHSACPRVGELAPAQILTLQYDLAGNPRRD